MKAVNNAERYFYISVDTIAYDVSCYVSGTDALLEIMSTFTTEFGYGVEFNITEISKEAFDNAE